MARENREANPAYIPYKQGYLPVPGGHELYYECVGNPNGMPVLFLHGGPGSGFSDHDKRFFDLNGCNVMMFDQRGAGRSKPFASTENNTTQDLLGDISTVLDALGQEKAFLFGGSWGSTLALAFALEHPDRVSGMLLRGIFFGDHSDVEFYVGGGIKTHFPDVWNRFVNLVPDDKRDQIPQYYLSQMHSPDEATREKYTYEWARYEASIFKLAFKEEDLPARLEGLSYRSLSPLEALYMAEESFLPDGYLRRNATRLSTIPTTIVHGRYDFVCRPQNAFELHESINGSVLFIEEAGHSSSEQAIERRLTREMKRISRRSKRTN